MIINVLDKNFIRINTIDTKEVISDEFIQYLDTGASTYEVKGCFDKKLNNDLDYNNYLCFYYKDKLQLMEIKEIEETEVYQATNKNVYAEFIGTQLYNSNIRPCIIEGNIEKFLNIVLQDTKYKVGIISPTLDNNVQTTQIKQLTTVYEVLQNSIATYNNIEYEFRVECISSIKGEYEFYIDVYADGERGNKTYKRFEHDFNIYGVKRKGNTDDYVSGLIAEGKNGIDFKDVYWSIKRGDPLDKPEGQDFLLNPAVADDEKEYTLGVYKSQTAETPIDLLYETYYKLLELSKIKVDFKVQVYITDIEYKNIGIGDTVYVINKKFEPPIQLEARINILTISFANSNNNKIELSNYKEVKSKIKYNNINEIIDDVVDSVTGLKVGKLSQQDILTIKDLLAKLDLQQEEINRILSDIESSLKDENIVSPDATVDLENYDEITISNMDNGLWIGDKNVYDILKYKLHNINTTTENVSENAKEYAEAVKYYATFDLGKNQNNSTLLKLSSTSNKYKLYVMVNYWCKKFGLDTAMVYMLIMAESNGDPYYATSYSGGGYGLLQCERDAYFGKKQTIKFLDGTKKTFTPSYSTMRPGNGNTTVNGVTVDKNINNQIMFGCYELRYNLELWHYNIFATLIGYNMGIGAMGWILNKYVCDTYGYTFNGGRNIATLPTSIKNKCYEVLDTYKGPFASYRKQWQDNGGGGTLRNIELYLRYYKSSNNSLPYAFDKNGSKIGYGVNTPSSMEERKITGSEKRNLIVDKAKEIVNLHKQKLATYDQTYRTWDDTKRRKHPGIFYGCKNPICYDCSSFVTCCYTYAGLTSIKGAANYCWDGSLVKNATAKSGYMMWKVDAEGIKKALPGDIVMDANFKVTSDNLTKAKMTAKNATHHTMIYIGEVDGVNKVAHASKWAYPYDAIKLSSISYYQNKGTAFFLRPYELAEADKIVSSSESTGGENETVVSDNIVEDLNIFTIKATPNALPSHFLTDNDILIQDLEDGDIINKLKYPTRVSYIFLHFGPKIIENEELQRLKNLILALRDKYKEIPIFVAKQWKVSSSYSNYKTINNKIDEYNLTVEAFANEEPYVIFLDIGDLDTSNSTDGWSYNNPNAVNNYYNAVVNAIKSKVIAIKPTTDNIQINKNVTLQPLNTLNLGTLNSLEVKLPTTVDLTFWSRLIFTTQAGGEPFKFIQSDELYLEGTDCISGGLIAQAGTTYTILVMSNADTQNYRGMKYFGTVTGIKSGESYNVFEKFIGAEQIVKNAITFFDNNNKFVYNRTTPMTYANNIEANKSKWYTNNKYHIDCSTLSKILYAGYNFQTSPYCVSMTKFKKNPKIAWSELLPRTAAEQAKHCVSKGWVLGGIDTVNYTNVPTGALMFWDRDNGENGRYMNISHSAICIGPDDTGVNRCIEVTNPGGPVVIKYIKDNTADKLLFVAYPRKV